MDTDGVVLEPTVDTPMDHVVLVIFENRSFDSLLGHLYSPGREAGLRGGGGQGLKIPSPRGRRRSRRATGPRAGFVYYGKAANLATPTPDPGEEYQHTNTQLFNIVDPANRFGTAHKTWPPQCASPGPGPDDGRVRHRLHQQLRGPECTSRRTSSSTARSCRAIPLTRYRC